MLSNSVRKCDTTLTFELHRIQQGVNLGPLHDCLHSWSISNTFNQNVELKSINTANLSVTSHRFKHIPHRDVFQRNNLSKVKMMGFLFWLSTYPTHHTATGWLS